MCIQESRTSLASSYKIKENGKQSKGGAERSGWQCSEDQLEMDSVSWNTRKKQGFWGSRGFRPVLGDLLRATLQGTAIANWLHP